MGTRHLIIAFYKGKYRIAQYGQWDGYPEGQGKDVLDFLRKLEAEPADKAEFLSKLEVACFISQDELKDKWAAVGVSKDAEGWVTMEQSNAFRKVWPWLSRDCGSEVLQHLLTQGPGLELYNNLDFAQDSLFCEWAYVVDYDKGLFEVYEGFNDEPLVEGERFHLPDAKPNVVGDTAYRAVKLAKSWPLNALPPDEEFLKELRPPEDEEEDAA